MKEWSMFEKNLIKYCKIDFKSKSWGKNTPLPSLELPWGNFILSAQVLNLNEWQLGIMKGIKIKSVAIFQVLTTAKVAVYEEVLSTENSLFTQSCLIRKDYLKHLTDTEYFRYVLGEHICSNAKFNLPDASWYFLVGRPVMETKEGMIKTRYFRMRLLHREIGLLH